VIVALCLGFVFVGVGISPGYSYVCLASRWLPLRVGGGLRLTGCLPFSYADI
jgi:hypothetical protein